MEPDDEVATVVPSSANPTATTAPAEDSQGDRAPSDFYREEELLLRRKQVENDKSTPSYEDDVPFEERSNIDVALMLQTLAGTSVIMGVNGLFCLNPQQDERIGHVGLVLSRGCLTLC